MAEQILFIFFAYCATSSVQASVVNRSGNPISEIYIIFVLLAHQSYQLIYGLINRLRERQIEKEVPGSNYCT